MREVLIARLEDSFPLFFYGASSNSSQLYESISQVNINADKLYVLDVNSNERIIACRKQELAITVLSPKTLSIQTIQSFIDEVDRLFTLLIDLDDMRYSDKAFTSNLKLKQGMKQLEEKYQNAVVNPLDKIQLDLSSVKETVNDNIENIIKNAESLEGLQDTTDNLREVAAGFSHQSETLKKKIAQRDLKVKIITGCIIVCVLVYVVIVFAM